MSKLWHDVQAVRVQPLELPVGRLKQIGLIIATAVTAALCIQGLILNHESRKLTQSRISLSQAETLLTSGAGDRESGKEIVSSYGDACGRYRRSLGGRFWEGF